MSETTQADTAEPRERVLLCVDDEENILQALRRLLRKEDYRVVTALGGKQALEMLVRENPQVVLTDQRMPDLAGTEVLKRVREQYPETIRLILSGYADVGTILDSINLGELESTEFSGCDKAGFWHGDWVSNV
ncbi:MAG: response regulator [Verrucomicrobiae bacterium]|nr:response regulator [Verrucomicrobiae bacterium]